MRVIRSSELGSFLYCRRAWWYQNQGAPSTNQAEMMEGTRQHQQYGQQVLTIRLLRLAGWVLLLAAVGFAAAAIASSLVR